MSIIIIIIIVATAKVKKNLKLARMTTSVLKQDPNTKGLKERYLSLGQKAFFQALDRKQLTAQPKTDVI